MIQFFKSSILTRLWLVFGLLYFFSVTSVGFLFFRTQEEEILEAAAIQSRHRSELAAFEFKSLLFGAERDISLLAASPSLREFLEDNSASNLDDLAELFEQFLKTREEYFQVRYLLASNAKEILRLDKRNNQVMRQADSLLQIKSGRGYIEETIKLKQGEYYFSDINLNKEFNKVSLPEIKTLRAASPIYDANGILQGLVVININLNKWIEKIKSISSSGNDIIILKNNGEYVSHPIDSLSLGLDKKHQHISSNDLRYADAGKKAGKWFERAFFNDEEVYISSELLEYNTSPQRVLLFSDLNSSESLFTSIREKRREIVGQGIIIFALGLLIIYWLAKSLTRPLSRMIQEISGAESAEAIRLSESKRLDEFGSVARSFEKLASEFKQEADTAKKASEEKETFLASFSHELRTPLNSIMGMTEVLLQNEASPKQQSVLKTLKYAVHNLRALIGDVLDSSKINSGNIELKKEPVLLSELGQNIVLSHKQEADSKALKLSFELDSDLDVAVLSDYLRLYQVINNLVSNAVKFTEEGFVKLKISKGLKSKVLFEVIDSGPGIKPEDAAMIFQRYKQSDQGKRRAQGLGLGLSIANDLLKLMNAELRLESVPEKGANFSFELELERAGEETKTQTSSKLKPAKILYIDDIAINRFTFTQLLESDAHEIHEAESCSEGLEILNTVKPDVIIMDLKMPETDGFECIRKMRPLGDFEFIALSANLGDVERAKLEGLGVTYALEKPLLKVELNRILQLILSEKLPYYRRLKLFFDGADEDRIHKAMELMIQEISKALKSLEKEGQVDSKVFQDLKHKLKPSLEILEKSDLLDMEESGFKEHLSGLLQELSNERALKSKS